MKTDAEVRLLMKERAKGKTQEQAAAKAGMSVRTARKYERAAALPSQLKQPRAYRTHPNPFADDWPWAVEQLVSSAVKMGPTAALTSEPTRGWSEYSVARQAMAHPRRRASSRSWSAIACNRAAVTVSERPR